MTQGINLHSIVRGAINTLHPDETIQLYKSLGHVNVKGELLPRYAAPVSVPAQVQSLSDAALFYANKVGENDVSKRCYLFATETDRASGLFRPLSRGGDMICRTAPDGTETWWLVTATMEDFTKSGWVCVRITLQVNGVKPEQVVTE